MQSMSNKFRQKGPNKLMYPPKNGPIAVAKRLRVPLNQLPAFDPHDEITGDPLTQQNITLQYATPLSELQMMGYDDQHKNLRQLLKHAGDLGKVMEDYLHPQTFEGIYIGDRVTRGPDWKWGNQDGGVAHEGTVRGLRQWHPADPPNKSTEVVVLWDHGMYGNYRFGYKGAYDVQVIDRSTDEKDHDNLISVGQRVMRKQPNWRWGNQDGGLNGLGTIVELYASPAPFEGGARVAVLWDHEKAKYRSKAEQFKRAHPRGDDEWYGSDGYSSNEMTSLQKNRKYFNADETLQKFRNFRSNPHQVRKKRKKYQAPAAFHEHNGNPDDSDEHSSEWDEPDFEEILSKPIPKYRWCLNDPKTEFGIASDVTISQKKQLSERKFLMIDDRVKQSSSFRPRRRPPKSEHGIVLKVEQSDPRRVEPSLIKGDKVYTTWSSHQWYTFETGSGTDDIEFFKRGQVFSDAWSRIKVGDRVQRGVTWKHQWGNEDGGHEAKGTVVCIQYVLQTAGILAKVRWDRTGHINFYSWGFKDIYDLKKAAPGL